MRAVVVISACMALACSPRDARMRSAANGRTVAGDVASSVASASPAALPSSTDPQIFAVLDEANAAEIAAARVALRKSSNPHVKTFARLMIVDHTTMQATGQKLADSLSITPQPPTPDTMAEHAQQETDSLIAAPEGPAFDAAYMKAQVADHHTVLTLLDTFAAQAENPRLRALITSAQPVVEKHLRRANAVSIRLAPQA